MPIPIEDYATPKWIRFRERYTIAGIEDAKAVFVDFDQYPRSYRDGVYPQAGYNVNHNSTRVEKINLRNDDITLKPY